MSQLLTIHTAAEFDQLPAAPKLPSLSHDEFARHGADAHCLALADDGQPVGRCSLWWRDAPSLPGHRVGLIGHYAGNEGPGARRLLEAAAAELARHGCTLAVGPMDGNTWRRYRLVTDRGTEPPFFLEPDNPDDWPRQFAASGFTPLAEYFSAVNPDLSREDPRLARAEKRFRELGVQIRPIDLDRFEDDLRRIYAVSEVSFRDNFLYTPIAEDEFLAQYRPVRQFVRSELVLLAEQAGRPVGFIFNLPDVLQARRGQAIDTVIVKTVAVLPERACAGLGSFLVAYSQTVAHRLGYRRAIHALMHETNRSRNISAHYARTMRRYTLFAKPL